MAVAVIAEDTVFVTRVTKTDLVLGLWLVFANRFIVAGERVIRQMP